MGFHVGRRERIFGQHFPDLDLIEKIKKEEYQEIFKILPKYDAFVDNPWHLLYKAIAERYPNARFILTTRSEGEWLKSAKRYFGHKNNVFRELTYGHPCPIGNEEMYLNSFRKHNQEVQDFFKNESSRLLILPLESENKWELLAGFLVKEAPAIDYPEVNKSISNSARYYKLLKVFNVYYLEVFFTLIYVRALILFFPFKQIAEKMAKPLNFKNQIETKSKQSGKAIKLANHVKSIGKKVPFRVKCFEQALAIQLLLNRRGIPSEIAFGLSNKTDKLSAHAWRISQGVTLSGQKGKENFSKIKSFNNYSNS